MWRLATVLVICTGCGDSKSAAPPPPPPMPAASVADAAPPPIPPLPPIPPPMPMPIAFEDCKSGTSTWRTGGPRPAVPSEAELEAAAFEQMLGTGTGSGFGAAAVDLGDLTRAMPPGANQGAPAFGNGRPDPGMRRYQPIGDATTAGVRIGMPNVDGDGLAKDIIQRYVKRALPKLESCYQVALKSRPDLAGHIQTRFVILQSGLPVSPSSQGVDNQVGDCFSDVMRTIAFPKPTGGGVVAVTCQFQLVLDLHPERRAPEVQPGRYAPPPPPPPQPNPLRDAGDALAACFRAGPEHAGAVVVELAYDKDGKATATVNGIADPAESACVLAIAAQAKRGDPKIAKQRCPLAFGVLAADGIAPDSPPAIELAADVPDDKTLAAALDKQVPPPAHPAAAKPVLVVGPAVVLRPAEAAPMPLVWHAIDHLEATRDLVLAAKRGDRWQVLSPFAVPAVPRSGGGVARWSPVRHAPRAGSVVVRFGADGKVAVETTGTHAKKAAPIARADLAAALAALHAELASSDLAIVAHAGATFGDVVAAIDASTAAGFTAWSLVP